MKKTTMVATIASSIASLSMSIASLSNLCHHNDPTKYVCPLTSLITNFCGYEAGLKHQQRDLENYNSEGCTISNVVYRDETVHYVVPEGYSLKMDETGNMVGYRTSYHIIGSDSLEEYMALTLVNQMYHTAPNGVVSEEGNQMYHMTPNGVVSEEGNQIYRIYDVEQEIVSIYDGFYCFITSEKIAPQVIVADSDSLIYQLILSDDHGKVNVYNCEWSYVDGEFINTSIPKDFVPRLEQK